MVKLTPAEKAALKEAKKVEKIRLQEEFKKSQRRAQLQREIATQEQCRKVLNEVWKNMMLEIMSPIFKKDIEVMCQTFERALDKKNHLIHFTIELINQADGQVARTVSSFCNTVDTMINKFLSDLDDLFELNNKKTQELLHRGDTDAAAINSNHNEAEMNLKLLLYQSRSNAEADGWATRGDHLVKEDEMRSNFLNLREDLKSSLEDFYNNVWDEYKNTLKHYVSQTAEIQKALRKLRRKENIMSCIIAKQSKKMDTFDSLLRRLKSEYAAYESGEKQAVFRRRQREYKSAYSRMQRLLAQGSLKDENQVIKLVQEAESCIAWLTKANKKGEKILKLMALCRKYETSKEKVLPYGTDGKSARNAQNELRQMIEEDCLASSVLTSCTGLALLWNHISGAELVKLSLLREKEILETENAQLELHLKGTTDKNMQPATTQCICGSKSKLRDYKKYTPIAIDGNMAAHSMNRY